MRSLILLACFLSFSFMLPAAQYSLADEFEPSPSSSLNTALEQVEEDLLNNMWTVENTNAERSVFQFHEYGLVDVIFTDENGELSLESLMWKLEQDQGGVNLTLTDSKFNEHTIHLKANCDGLNATILDSLAGIELILKPTISAQELDRMENSLEGEWNSVTFPSDMAKVLCDKDGWAGITSMQLLFHGDGTYTKVCETDAARLEENGFFEITPDGQYLIFYASGNAGNPAETYDATVVRIQYLTIGEMVLEQPVHALGFAGLQQTAVRSIAYMQ